MIVNAATRIDLINNVDQIIEMACIRIQRMDMVPDRYPDEVMALAELIKARILLD